MPIPIDPHHALSLASNSAALRFTNRHQETSRFLELLDAPVNTPLPLLMYYGVAGTGKTTLLRHLQRQCDQRGVRWAAVDLKRYENVARALPQLAGELQERHRLCLNSFKRALVVLVAKEASSEVVPEVAGRSKGLRRSFDIAIDGLGLVPVISLLANAVKLTKSAASAAFDVAMKKRALPGMQS